MAAALDSASSRGMTSSARLRRRIEAIAPAATRGVHAGARICVGYTRIRELLYPVCVALELSIPTKLSLYKSD